jgi:hypothetical protein
MDRHKRVRRDTHRSAPFRSAAADRREPLKEWPLSRKPTIRWRAEPDRAEFGAPATCRRCSSQRAPECSPPRSMPRLMPAPRKKPVQRPRRRHTRWRGISCLAQARARIGAPTSSLQDRPRRQSREPRAVSWGERSRTNLAPSRVPTAGVCPGIAHGFRLKHPATLAAWRC